MLRAIRLRWPTGGMRVQERGQLQRVHIAVGVRLDRCAFVGTSLHRYGRTGLNSSQFILTFSQFAAYDKHTQFSDTLSHHVVCDT